MPDDRTRASIMTPHHRNARELYWHEGPRTIFAWVQAQCLQNQIGDRTIEETPAVAALCDASIEQLRGEHAP